MKNFIKIFIVFFSILISLSFNNYSENSYRYNNIIASGKISNSSNIKNANKQDEKYFAQANNKNVIKSSTQKKEIYNIESGNNNPIIPNYKIEYLNPKIFNLNIYITYFRLKNLKNIICSRAP